MSSAEDTVLTVTLTATDVENDPLTFEILTPPAHGSLSGVAPNLSYRPATNYYGPDQFTFRAHDGQAYSSAVAVAITVLPVDDAPVANSQNLTLDEDTNRLILLSGVDVEGDGLMFVVVASPVHGTLSGTPPHLVYTPTTNYFGNDSFQFIVSDSLFASDPAVVNVNVRPVNDAPVADPQSLTTPEDTALNITITGSDVEHDSLTFTIVTGPAHGSLHGTVPNLVYSPAADYFGPDSFTFKVNDGPLDSAVAVVSLSVTPVNDAPIAGAQSLTLEEDGVIDVTLAGSDVENDALTFVVVSSPLHGSLSGSAPNVRYTPAADYFGSDRFTFRVIDGQLDSALATVTIVVNPVNDAPTLAAIASVTLNEDAGLQTVNLTGISTGAVNEIQVLTVTASSSNPGLIPNPTVTYNSPNATGTLEFTPVANASGTATITVTVNDGQSQNPTMTRTFMVSVNAVNDAPAFTLSGNVSVLEDFGGIQTVTVTPGPVPSDEAGQIVTYRLSPTGVGFANVSLDPSSGTVSISAVANGFGTNIFTVTANDGQSLNNTYSQTFTLAVSAVNDAPVANAQLIETDEDIAVNIVLTGSDVDGDALTYTIVNAPTNGIVSGMAPNLTYLPATNFFGADTFTFKVNDGQTDSPTAVVSITVTPVNDAPVAQAQNLSTAEDTVLTVTLTASDVENDPLTFAIVTPPAHGSLGGLAPNLSYRPATNYNGPDQFTYRAFDGQAYSAMVVISISVLPVNDAPVANSQSVTTDEDTPKLMVLSGADVEGDALTFTVVTPPAHGTLSGTPPNLTYTPATNYFGPDSFTFKVNDGQLNSDLATVSITIRPVNDAPVIEVIADQIVWEGDLLSVQAVASDPDIPINTLTYRLGTNAPVGMIINPTNGLIRWTPTESQGPSTNLVTVIVTDNGVPALSATRTFVVTVLEVNDSPTAFAQALTTDEDTLLNLVLHGSDPENSPLTYLIVNGPAHGTLVGAPPNLAYRPLTNFFGSDSFTFKVSDGELDSAVATISILVNPVNDAPVAFPLQLDTVEGVATNFTLLAFDVESDTLTYTMVSAPTNGVLSGVAPNLTYTPNANFSGADSFTFKVNDGQLDSSAALVSILVNATNHPPVVSTGPPQTHSADQAFVLNGSVSDDGLPVGGTLSSRWTSVSGPGLVTLDDPASPTTRAHFSGPGTYILRLTGDDSELTSVAEITLTVLAANQPPRVNPGPNQRVLLPASAVLNGFVSDDGLPAGAALLVNWTKVSGPGEVTFGAPAQTNTSAAFSTSGNYVLRLTATDSALTTFAQVTLAVRNPAQNEPPIVNAGPDLVIGLTNAVVLNGHVTDDGLPANGILSATWTVMNGPGTVVFEDATDATTLATFSALGTYSLRLSASDSQLTANDEVIVTVYPFNQPPTVNAGPNQVLIVPDPALLTPSGLQPASTRLSLSTELMSEGRWNNAVGQPGLSGQQVVSKGLAATGTNLFVSSDSVFMGGQWVNGIGRWDGTNFWPLYDPRPENPNDTHSPPFGFVAGPAQVGAMGARGDEVFLSGAFLRDPASRGQGGALLARWTGTNWVSWEFFGPPGQTVSVKRVLAVSNAVYVAGEFIYQPTNAPLPLGSSWPDLPITYDIAQWDGTNWVNLGEGVKDYLDTTNPEGFPHGVVRDIAVGKQGELYVAGTFAMPTPTGGATNIAVWNGVEWAPLGNGLSGYNGFIPSSSVNALAVGEDGFLYAAGDFTTAGGIAVNRIARWDGTNWSALGAGIDGVVWTMTTFGRDLYVGGAFQRAGGLRVNQLARWNGEFWSPLGSGPNNGVQDSVFVTSLAAAPKGIYVGGWFSGAGGLPARNIALWELNRPPGPIITLHGKVTDDGLPLNSSLALSWTKVSGPGDVTFASPNTAVTTATFSQLGTYVLRLLANDSEFTILDEVTVEVRGNQPPVVDAGSNLAVDLGTGAELHGTVTDDGLISPPASTWSFVSATPSTAQATVINRAEGRASVQFDQPGTYVLRFSANDGQFTATDDLIVTVRAANQPPTALVVANHNATYTSVSLGEALHMSAYYLNDDGLPYGLLNLGWTQASGPGSVLFDSPDQSETDVHFTAVGTYLIRLVLDDGELTGSSEMTVDVLPRNQPPVPILVYAGASQTVRRPASAQLEAVVRYDGLQGPLTEYWSSVSGPGTVTFENVNQRATTASFSAPGIYRLSYTVYPGDAWWLGQMDEVVFTVLPAPEDNVPPQLTAGPPQTILLTDAPILLTGVVVDDGQPLGVALTYEWTQLSGPAAVFASDTNGTVTNFAAPARVLLSAVGTYVFQLSASDGQMSATSTVSIQVQDPLLGNFPPLVDAGPDATAAALQPVALNGTALDDGLPGYGLDYDWVQVSGPSYASFADSRQPQTTVTFDYPGVYVLRFTSDDGEFSNGDDVVISVAAAANLPPVVDAGRHFTVFPPANSFTLPATASDDGFPIGNTLTYNWTVDFATGPVEISDSTILNPLVTIPNASDPDFHGALFYFVLQVSDGEFTSSSYVAVGVADPTSSNQVPMVDAGPDVTITLPDGLSLNGTSSDDVYAYSYWEQAAGPLPVNFNNESDPATTVWFYAPGTYRLRLTAYDYEYGFGSDDLVVTVLPATNTPPLVIAGPTRTIPLANPVLQLQGIVSYAGEMNLLSSLWTVDYADGTVTFADAASPASLATFSAPGYYNLVLTATDGTSTGSSHVTIQVTDTSIVNHPPVVDAGPDQILASPGNLFVQGNVSDDGPLDNVWSFWQVALAPPGSHSRVNSLGSFGIARLDVPGVYVLRLLGDDGFSQSADDRVIVVGATGSSMVNQAPIVHSGFNQTVALDVPVALAGLVADDGLPLGAIVNSLWEQVSGPGVASFADPTAAQTTVTFNAPGDYTLRLTANDTEFSASHEIVIQVVADLLNGNHAPTVSAGVAVAAVTGVPVTLAGSVTDDGLPVGGTAGHAWNVVSGPDRVYFANAQSLATTAVMFAPGTYVLRLTAHDGQLTAYDDLTVTLSSPTNQPPAVFAGMNLTVTRPGAAQLDGLVLDDGQPLGYPLTFQWAKISGPGVVTFNGLLTNETSAAVVLLSAAPASATFSAPGEYVLRLSASDTAFTNFDEVTITVLDGTNAPPVVNAGPDLATSLPFPAILQTSVTDDGLPNGTVEIVWTQESGPGTASLTTLNGNYRAAFNQAGTYVLRLTATDGALTSFDEVTVTVYPPTPPPTVVITSPVDASSVAAPTAVIGTASSPILQSYKLEYRLKPADSLAHSGGEGQGEGAWLTLATGNISVNNAPLGTLDPTLALNGIYELRLSATDLAGRTSVSEISTVIFERNLKIGSFTLSFNDLTVPVAGIPITLTRTYDSRDKRVGDFGVGWNLDLKNIRLQKNRNLGANWQETSSGGQFPIYALQTSRARTVTITFPNGKTHKFAATPTPASAFGLPITYPVMNFVPLSDTRGKLVPMFEQDGEFISDDQLVFGAGIPGTGNFISFEKLLNPPPGPADNILWNPDLFRFTTLDGYSYILSETDGLRQLTDPNGNTLTITTNGILHSSGLSVRFERDNLGRITNLVDTAGHAMTYAYNAAGNLANFVDRSGNTNSFTYDDRHNLLTVADPNGIVPLASEYDDAGRLVGHTDATGQHIEYTHDVANRLTSVRDRTGNVTTQEFDEDGNLVRTINPLGHETAMTYDEDGRRLTMTNPLGQITSYVYDPSNGGLVQLINALNETNTFAYNEQGQVIAATEKDGTLIRTDYDAANQLTNAVDALGQSTVYAYNSLGKPVFSRNALGQESRSLYDQFGNLLRSTNALGHIAEYAYDEKNHLTEQVLTRTLNAVEQHLTNRWVYDAQDRLIQAINADGSTQRSAYDANGHLISKTDELERRTTYTYDVLSRLIRTTYPDGTFEGYTYDAEGRKIAMANRLGQVTRYVHDALGRVVSVINSDGTSAANFFNAAGRLVASTDARGNSTRFGHDALGRVIAMTNTLNEVTRYTYDARGNQVTSTDALGRITTNVFDLANRLAAMLYPDGSSVSMTYDALGRKVADTDQLGRMTLYGFDALGRLTAVTNALGFVTRYEYDAVGEQTAQIDANGRITRYEYDQRGRRTSRILPLGQQDHAIYDALGNLTALTDFNGNTTAYQYDVMNRVLLRTPDPRLGEPAVAFSYNDLGQRTAMSDASGITTYEYDNRNRLLQKSTPQGTLAYTYDANGNVTSMQSGNVNGADVSYEYDALNRLAAVNDTRLGRTLYQYDAVGNLGGFTYPNGVQHVHSYDTVNRLTGISTFNSQLSTLGSFSYTLAPTGHRLTATEAGGRVVNYAYDLLNRLTSESIGGASSASPGSVGYAYDAVGNRLARNSALPGILAANYNYDANDRLGSDLYDANGNTVAATLRPDTTGTPAPVNDRYDSENHLVNRNNGQITLVYDGDGNRVRKTVGGVTTYYLVDDLNPTGYAQVLEEHVSLNSQPSTLNKVYTWGQALISQILIDPITQTPSAIFYYGYDGQGSVRFLTDGTGQLTDTYTYDAFGNLISQSAISQNPTPNSYLYQGEQYDPDLKLYYLRARYADTDRGRFWSMDSFEGFGTDPQSLHKYTFNHNDPVNRRDPSGHYSLAESQMVTAVAPLVRGALQAMQSSFTSCYARTVVMGAATGSAVGGAVAGSITALIQAITGDFNSQEIADAIAEGMKEGALEGGLLAANPFAFSAYQGMQTMNQGMEFWNVINDPTVPVWQKYVQAVGLVTSALPAISPKLAKRMSDLLEKYCFPAGTLVAVEQGSKPIEEIAEGDLVWAQSDRTGEISLKRVKQVFVNVAAALVVLHAGTNVVEATPEHPFWVADQGWKSAGQVQVGDDLITLSGERIKVTAREHKPGQFTVYNFEVEDAHTYFVGRELILVHNACEPIRRKQNGQFAKKPGPKSEKPVFTDSDRRARWKELAEDPSSTLTEAQRIEVKERGWRGPRRVNEFGEIETMELSHEPIPLRAGGSATVPRWSDEHAAIDEYRKLRKR